MEPDDPKTPEVIAEALEGGEAPPRKRRLETPQERAQRLEKEKQTLLAQIAGDFTGDLRSQVAYVLNHYPEARRSDKTLSIRVWETFYEERLHSGYNLDVLYDLPAQTTITRTRAKLQNEYGLFRPDDVVLAARKSRRKDLQEEMRADKPDAPVISVYADESGRSDPFLVVGSVWSLDIQRQWRISRGLEEWKRSHGVERELKFGKLTRANVVQAVDFVSEAMKHSELVGLKACTVQRSKVIGKSEEELLYRLYYELVMAGIEHEVKVGRVTLPRWIALVKDEGVGTDALAVPELERQLKASCKDYFGGNVVIDSVVPVASEDSVLVQLADLFAGSVARVLNKKGGESNQKDEFATFFEKVAGFSFGSVVAADAPSDFVYVHHLP
jgi:hypothetical protein